MTPRLFNRAIGSKYNTAEVKMEVIETVSGLNEIKKGCVLSIGNFDGVHLGHREIIEAVKHTARRRNTAAVVMTFYPHPAVILHPEESPGVLTPLELKKQILETCGVEALIVLKDSYRILNLSPADFVNEFLIHHISPSVVVEGRDFNFGYGRSGDIRTLQQLGAENNFEVVAVEPKEVELSNGRNRVSSTLIRHLLHKSSVCDAATALGRPYRLIGDVVRGKGKGKHLGFATANIHPQHQIIPAEGVYAGFVEIGDSPEQVCKTHNKFPAALSIGRAKTFITDHPLMAEAHILEGSVENLYGKWLAMDFVRHIRHQRRFESEKELAAEIAKDCQKAKRILATDCTD